jgi:hypothetical protein
MRVNVLIIIISFFFVQMGISSQQAADSLELRLSATRWRGFQQSVPSP